MLVIENLSAEYYRRGKTIPAVQGASLKVEPGQAFGLVGESGSGKSTIALAILRLISPPEGRITGGKILFQGQDLLTLDEESMRSLRGKSISMVFQDPFTSLNPVMTIEEQLAEILEAHHLRRRPRESGDPENLKELDSRPPLSLRRTARQGVVEGRFRRSGMTNWSPSEALEHVQMDPARVLKAYPHQLSGGQRQRVLIAGAILTKPRLLLADEPTTALDVLVQKDLLELLFRLQKELGMGMLFITHNLALVAAYTQKIAVMKEGRIVEEGTPGEIFRRPAHPYTQELLAAIPRFKEK